MARWPFHVFYLAVAQLLGIGVQAASAQDELVATNNDGKSVTFYPRTANGNVAPLHTISGPATGLGQPWGVAVDQPHNEVIVVVDIFPSPNRYSLNSYPLTGNGNVAPLRTIAGPTTELAGATAGQLALDQVNDEVLLGSGNSVLTFARTASGNVPPLRKIVGPATGLYAPLGVAVDPTNNEILVANTGDFINSVTVYPRTANGNVAPIRTIIGTATQLASPTGLALDLTHNEIFVVNQAEQTLAFTVTVYPRTANGDVAPLRTIAGPATKLNQPFDIATDRAHDEIFVANGFFPHAITVYPRIANGNVAPIRTISGPATLLNRGMHLAVVLGAAPPPASSVRYAAKFICGQPTTAVVAPGTYFTAINVHNPGREPVDFEKRVALALPEEKAGPVSRAVPARLLGDHAFEIDCPDILNLLHQRGFAKGFVLIESRSELDVVAVYTAAGATKQVETLFVERVPPRLPR